MRRGLCVGPMESLSSRTEEPGDGTGREDGRRRVYGVGGVGASFTVEGRWAVRDGAK